MKNTKVLWVDDEIDLLKPHIMFLQLKGIVVLTSNNGNEALEIIKKEEPEIVFLDENMPGMSGLETLTEIKKINTFLPVVMITKSEEEHIMDNALGSNITDYLIKPVNPNQIWLSIKKIIENEDLISKRTTQVYQREFRELNLEIMDARNFNDWENIYKKLVTWEMKLEKASDEGISDILIQQKHEANLQFSKFIIKNYPEWLKIENNDMPLMSHTALKDRVFPTLKDNKCTFLIVIDNLRFDQWRMLEPFFRQYYNIASEDICCSILPSVTQYARNALFAGLMPSVIEKKYPQYWKNENEEGNKNDFESELLTEYMKRYGLNYKHHYAKVLNADFGKKITDTIHQHIRNPLNVVIYNFVDMLSHARTDVDLIRELASDEAAYRSVTASWFEHSPLFELIKVLADKKIPLFITADHGSVRVQNPVKIIGDKSTNTNLRYKVGKSIEVNAKDVFEVRNPESIFLPKINVSSSFVFARNNDFFAYPNNYNYYVNYYKDTFQHGGISMEEMMVPFINLVPK